VSKPQQPELHRSGHTPVDPAHAKETVSGGGGASGGLAPVPEANQPGHHPEVEQDEPQVRARHEITSSRGEQAPPATSDETSAAATHGGATTDRPTRHKPGAPARHRFGFAFDALHLPAAAAFGVTPLTAWVDVDDKVFRARFGLWRIETPLDNIAGAEFTGPYKWFKVIGPPHVSIADRGLTFATNARRGVCIRFRRPVAGVEPTGLLRHPGLTVTVQDVAGLVATIDRRAAAEAA